MGEALWDALRALPKGSGVVVRHYSLASPERAALIKRIARMARARRLVVTIGGSTHGRHHGALTAPVHSLRERIAAERAGARLLFLSPVFATRSHPGARSLGRVRFGMIARDARVPVIALGGMDARRARSMKPLGGSGWAGIDGFLALGKSGMLR